MMMPGNAKRRHPLVEKRTADLIAWAETAPVNRLEEGTDHQIGIITASTSYQYVKEACGDRYPVLKLGMTWPLPERKIRDFAASVEQLCGGGGAGSLHRGALPGIWACIPWGRSASPALMS